MPMAMFMRLLLCNELVDLSWRGSLRLPTAGSLGKLSSFDNLSNFVSFKCCVVYLKSVLRQSNVTSAVIGDRTRLAGLPMTETLCTPSSSLCCFGTWDWWWTVKLFQALKASSLRSVKSSPALLPLLLPSILTMQSHQMYIVNFWHVIVLWTICVRWVCRYAWVLAECSACTEHMGWRFTAVAEETRPKAFWGIRRSQLADNSS